MIEFAKSYKKMVDLRKTLGEMPADSFIVVSRADWDNLESLRSQVAKLRESYPEKKFSVHKCEKGARIERTI